MNEDIIKFETAKLAKEKGLITKTTYGYCDNREKILDCEKYYSFNEDESIHGFLFKLYGTTYNATSQSVLQKWLRDNHRIHIEIPHYSDCPTKFFDDKNYDDKLGSYGIRIHEPNTQAKMDIFVSNINYEKYEDALEVALQEALKII